MRTPIGPSVTSVPEAVAAYEPPQVVAAPGLWESIKNGAKKLFRRKKKGGTSAPNVDTTPNSVVSGQETTTTSTTTSTTGTTPTPTLSTVESEESTEQTPSSQGGDEQLDPETEFKSRTPAERLTHLYSTLGATDAYLNAVYGDAELRGAAVAQGADTLVGFFAQGTLTNGAVERAPAAFTGEFNALMNGLAVGSAMTTPVRQGLRRMLPGMSVAQAQVAFGKRFAHDMTENGGSWTLVHITQVWDQLAVLPDQDVSDNTVLTTFQAISGGGGFGPSWEAPNTVNTIQLGEDISDPTFMAHTVRHEVGHAVHAQIPGQINPWLQSNVKFWFYNNDESGIRQLITELGGFPAKFVDPNGTEQNWDNGATSWVIELLKTYIGGSGSWNPARASVTDGQGAWQTAYWNAMPQAVKDVATNSPSHWYQNYSNFARGTKGSYFLNYWYARPFYMSDEAKSVVDATGDSYTAMSEKEFFANAYAEYFEDPAGYNDNSLWGGALPAGVKDFFKQVVVDRQPYTAPSPPPNVPGVQPQPPPPGPTGMAGTP